MSVESLTLTLPSLSTSAASIFSKLMSAIPTAHLRISVASSILTTPSLFASPQSTVSSGFVSGGTTVACSGISVEDVT